MCSWSFLDSTAPCQLNMAHMSFVRSSSNTSPRHILDRRFAPYSPCNSQTDKPNIVAVLVTAALSPCHSPNNYSSHLLLGSGQAHTACTLSVPTFDCRYLLDIAHRSTRPSNLSLCLIYTVHRWRRPSRSRTVLEGNRHMLYCVSMAALCPFHKQCNWFDQSHFDKSRWDNQHISSVLSYWHTIQPHICCRSAGQVYSRRTLRHTRCIGLGHSVTALNQQGTAHRRHCHSLLHMSQGHMMHRSSATYCLHSCQLGTPHMTTIPMTIGTCPAHMDSTKCCYLCC